MSAIKDGRYPVILNGKEYHFLFSLNVLDELQDRFGGYDKLDKVFDRNNKNMIKDLKWLLTRLINEGAEEGEPELTEQQVGKMIHAGNLEEVKNAIFGAFAYSANGGEEKEESGEDAEDNGENEGNAAGGQDV